MTERRPFINDFSRSKIIALRVITATKAVIEKVRKTRNPNGSKVHIQTALKITIRRGGLLAAKRAYTGLICL